MGQDIKKELAIFMKETSNKRGLGIIDWEHIAEQLIEVGYIHKVTRLQRIQIGHDFKRIAGALDRLFKDVIEIEGEDSGHTEEDQ